MKNDIDKLMNFKIFFKEIILLIKASNTIHRSTKLNSLKMLKNEITFRLIT